MKSVEQWIEDTQAFHATGECEPYSEGGYIQVRDLREFMKDKVLVPAELIQEIAEPPKPYTNAGNDLFRCQQCYEKWKDGDAEKHSDDCKYLVAIAALQPNTGDGE